MKYSIDEAKYDLRQIQSDTTQFHRMVNVASIITKLMSQKVNTSDMPIIVGGFSLELYTVGKYTTHDIDFVTSASILMDKLLLEIGFKKTSRMYHHDELNIAVDIVASALEPPAYDRVKKVSISGGDYVLVQSIESILYDRALDYERADSKEYSIYLISIRYDEIDFPYIKEELKKADPDALEAFVNWIKIASENL